VQLRLARRVEDANVSFVGASAPIVTGTAKPPMACPADATAIRSANYLC
jgi:hypothetical protein